MMMDDFFSLFHFFFFLLYCYRSLFVLYEFHILSTIRHPLMKSTREHRIHTQQKKNSTITVFQHHRPLFLQS